MTETVSMALEVTSLVVGYGGAPVVKGVSLDVPAGSVATILGPNGAGKSTFVKGIGGILTTDSGRVTLEGKDVTNVDASRLASLGMAYVPQNRDVFPPMTVKENLEVGGYLLSKSEIRDRITQRVVEFPQLGPLMGRTAGTLSGGERKLVAVARALMTDSRVLLLDEPTAALSPSMAENILHSVVRTIADRGVSIVMVEQRAQVAMTVSDLVCVLVNGQMAAADTPEKLEARPDFLELLAGVSAEALSHADAPRSHE
jgi:branched-chain amino acid transport system ATP-binding protein